MEEYVSKSGLGKVVAYSAEEFLKTPYSEYVKKHVLGGFVVLVLPDPKLRTTTKQSSYFFNDVKSERNAIEHFLSKAEENVGEKWLGKLLKTIKFN